MENEKKIAIQEAVSVASWCHNTNLNRGYIPMSLMIGSSIKLTCYIEGNLVTDSL